MNEILAGCKPAHYNLSDIIVRIGFVVNALNKIEPEQVSFACRGQADRYKDSQHNAPLFVAMSRSYQVCEDYMKMGDIVNIEGGGHAHAVFFKDVVGHDISGLSSVPAAKELMTLPRVISYSDECFTTSPESGFHPYYFGRLAAPKLDRAKL